MTVTTAIAVGLVAWLVLGTGLALLVGGMVRRRDRQRYGPVDVPRPRPAADDQVPAAADQVPATDQEPATGDQELATADQVPAAADQEPAADDQVPPSRGLRAGADRSARGPAGRGPARARD